MRVVLAGTTRSLAGIEQERSFVVVGSSPVPHELVLDYLQHYLCVPEGEREGHVLGTMAEHQYAALVTYRYLRTNQGERFRCVALDYPAEPDGVDSLESRTGSKLVFEDDRHQIYEVESNGT